MEALGGQLDCPSPGSGRVNLKHIKETNRGSKLRREVRAVPLPSHGTHLKTPITQKMRTTGGEGAVCLPSPVRAHGVPRLGSCGAAEEQVREQHLGGKLPLRKPDTQPLSGGPHVAAPEAGLGGTSWSYLLPQAQPCWGP